MDLCSFDSRPWRWRCLGPNTLARCRRLHLCITQSRRVVANWLAVFQSLHLSILHLLNEGRRQKGGLSSTIAAPKKKNLLCYSLTLVFFPGVSGGGLRIAQRRGPCPPPKPCNCNCDCAPVQYGTPLPMPAPTGPPVGPSISFGAPPPMAALQIDHVYFPTLLQEEPLVTLGPPPAAPPLPPPLPDRTFCTNVGACNCFCPCGDF